jgi:hypothetical protein
VDATKELRAANERLKELNKLKDDFVTTVSHELRTPLTSIRSFSEIVHDHPDLPIEERREFLQIIVQESERLTRLINDILAKMEAGEIEWHRADALKPPSPPTVAAELPTYEVTGFPITSHRVSPMGLPNVQERPATPTRISGGVPGLSSSGNGADTAAENDRGAGHRALDHPRA